MKLKDCLSRTNWADVKADLLRLFPIHAKPMGSLQTAYEELIRTKPLKSELHFKIGQFGPDCILPFYIVGFYGDCPKGYCLKFIPWPQWLGASLEPSCYSDSEIIAICLIEMAWAGFSSENVLMFKNEFINHENCLLMILSHEEAIELSEPNPIKRKQRLNEFNESLNLHAVDDLDDIWWVNNESAEHRQARFDLSVQIYCLGELETNYDEYRAKVTVLREDFKLRWPDSHARRPLEH